MRVRSLTATLSLAFAITTLVVFALVGGFEYVTLYRQINVQDDLDIVLAARHVRRFAQELQNDASVQTHADRLISQVLGNQALALSIKDVDGHTVLGYNIEQVDGTSAGWSTVAVVKADARVTEAAVALWHNAQGDPVRGVATEAMLMDGEKVTILVARHMGDRRMLLSRYRMRMYFFGLTGALLAFALSYVLIRAALRPLRDIAGSTGLVTVDKLGTRIAIENVPSELDLLVRSLNAMLERLDQGFARLSRFTVHLAHDMRTPLGNMRGATEVALARPRSIDEYQAQLASNLEECDRLSRMIENVLFLARAEHPQFKKNMRQFEVCDELAHVVAYFEGLAEDAGVIVDIAGTGMLTADLELFRRAISNLLANALRYTPRGGRIRLSVETVAEGIQIMVSNQGTPIGPLHIDKIFDRFYRADPSRSGSNGSTGLGLAIVRSIMDLHDGSVRVESDTNSTRFILYFPQKI